MQKTGTLRTVIAALMAAMTCVATMIIKIPLPATGGYANLGDCIVILSGIILGPLYGGAAAGIGSALADLLGGYAVYCPATFVIKAAMAALAAAIIKKPSDKKTVRIVITGLTVEAVMIVGYFVFEALIMGYGLAAAGAIPGNAAQGAVGTLTAALLMPVVKQLNITPLRGRKNDSEKSDRR